MNKYCEKHPGVKLNVWGSCPRCREEEEQKKEQKARENQRINLERERLETQRTEQARMDSFRAEQTERTQQLIEEQRAEREAAQQSREMLRERIEEERSEQRAEKEYQRIREGLPYFTEEYQLEWARLSRDYDRESSRLHSFREHQSALAKEIWERMQDGSLPPVVDSKALEAIRQSTDLELLDDLYLNLREVSRSSKRKRPKGLPELPDTRPSKSFCSFVSAVTGIVANRVMLEGTSPKPPGKSAIFWTVIYFIAGLLLIRPASLGAASFRNILFVWPSFLFAGILALRFVRYFKKKRRFEELSRDQEEFVELAQAAASCSQASANSNSVRSDKERDTAVAQEFARSVVGGEGIPNIESLQEKMKLQEELERHLHRIWLIPAEPYMNFALRPDSDSKVGKKLMEEFGDPDEFLDGFEQLENQYTHMKQEIIHVGDEVVRGIRIPDKKSIKLMRCISCGGPLSRSDNGLCPYCGSQYR